MDILEAIHTRRSIRSYAPGQVSQEQIDALLRAAMAAPSAGNAQPWQFVVIDDRSLLDRLADILPYAKMLKQTPVAIMILGDTSVEKYPGYWPLDCAAATQNLLLAAHGMGLGAVWTGLWPNLDRVRDVKTAIDFPETAIPMAMIPIGVPAQESKRVDRFQPARVHHNGW